jgi:hypothetical protein
MRLGDRDKTVRPASEHTIKATNTIGPTSRMKCGTNNRDASQTSCNTTPEHFVASTHGDDSINSLPNQMIC